MDRSWMKDNRLGPSFLNGLNVFLEHVEKHANDSNIPCPCTKCANFLRWPTIETLKEHLIMHGFDQRYTTWYMHEEEFSKSDATNIETNYSESHKFEIDLSDDEDDLTPEDAPATIEMVDVAEEEFDGDPEKFKKLIEDSEKPLYPGCLKFTKLSALVKLYNIKAMSGMADKHFSNLLELLKDMLPKDNEIPTSSYKARKILKALGMGYDKIHACPNDCILYRKEYENAIACPTCGESRWKINKHHQNVNTGVPAKVCWYFPPIPRFRRMFRHVETAEHLIWHDSPSRRTIDGQLRHPADSPAWMLVDQKWPEFAKDPRNLRLALSSDGINPHSNMSSRHSCWPVLMVIYNLPPWLCMKRKFMMLTMLISGPKQPGKDIDVYLAPLIDDLKTLWEVGVEAYDAYRRQSFNLRAVLLWTINDFPAYGILCGCVVKGYNGCPICAEKTYSKWLPHSKKVSYMGHRRYLPLNHKFRNQKKAFDGEVEDEVAPKPLTGVEVFEEVKMIQNSWGKKKKNVKVDKNSKKMNKQGTNAEQTKKRKRKEGGGTSKKAKGKDINEVTSYWKKKSIFFELEYWKYLLVRHNLDLMHIEKNVCESIIGTLLNVQGKSKDGLHARKDLEALGLRSHLAPQKVSNRKLYYLPSAPCTLSREDKRKFCRTLFDLKVPEGYSSNLRNCVSLEDLKLYGLKSHDYHSLMQQFLPLAIRSILPANVRFAITRLCFFFTAICSKEVDISKLGDIQNTLVETLCLLETYFPPAFFDVMIHLTVHLVREVKYCGPVYFRWMYPFERYMKVLKGYVRNRNRPEGCIAECYIAEEAVEFFANFFGGETVGIPPPRNEFTSTDVDGDVLNLLSISDGKPSSGGAVVDVNDSLWSRAHRTVLENTTEVLPYIEKHMSYLKQKNPRRKSEKWFQDEHNNTFIEWIHKQVEDELIDPDNNVSNALKWISHGPRHTVIKYNGYDINGCRYHTKSRDDTRVRQNSGVSLVATSMHITGSKDKNPVIADSCYYGVIEEIWLLDYNIFKIPLFKCAWVDSGSGIRKDQATGFTLVELGRLGHKTDPFILASHAKQVFYVQDQLDPRWYIVISTPQKDYRSCDNDDDTVDFEGQHPFNFEFPSVDTSDMNEDSPYPCLRTDCEGILVDTDGKIKNAT